MSTKCEYWTASGPTFIVPRIMVGSYFTIQLIGSTLHPNDAISIRALADTCGGPDTENMDPELVMKEPDRTLNALGTVESFSSSENAITGETEMTWTSWRMRIKDTVRGGLRLCYCSSIAETCGSPGTMSVFAGFLEIRGPSRGDVELVGRAS